MTKVIGVTTVPPNALRIATPVNVTRKVAHVKENARWVGGAPIVIQHV